MIDTKDILKMVKHIVRRDKGIADPQIMHPMREWLTGISITVLVVLVGAIFAAILYRSYDVQKDVDVVAPDTVVPYKKIQVERALSEYRAKRAAYEVMVGSASSPEQTTISASSSIEQVPPSNSDTVSTTTLESLDVPEEDSVDTSTDTTIAPDLAI